MTFAPISRRAMLRSCGVAIALPLLEAMAPASLGGFARAGVIPPAAQQRRRMVAICTTLGLHGPNFFPEQTGGDYKPSPYLELLQPLRNDFTVISGLSHPDVDGGHTTEASYLTAAPEPGRPSFRNSISLDQFAAGRLAPDTRFTTLALNTSGGNASLAWSQNGVNIPGDGSPSKVFARLFLQGSSRDIDSQVNKLKEGQSVLDTLAAETQRISRTLGHADRDKLDEYYTSVRQIEQRLVKSQAWSHIPKPKVTAPQPRDITNYADLIGCTRLMFDLVHLALQTDSTRIITLDIECTGQLTPIQGVTEAHHALTHHGMDAHRLAQLKIVESAEISVFAELLAKLKSTTEEDSNLLDRTMVCYGSNLGNASSHDNRNMPTILAGGGFNHGQHLAFDQKNNTPLCNLYVSMLQRLGVEADSFATGRGTLNGLEAKSA